MAYPNTESGYNMFDMLSMIQKSIRRGDYEHAGFAAEQLKGTYRRAMWNRLLVISCEDCFGVLTKEIVALKEKDLKQKNDVFIARAVALLCSAKKSRDACYFACNFVLASRKPREIKINDEQINRIYQKVFSHGIAREYNRFGFEQLTLFEEEKSTSSKIPEEESKLIADIATLVEALNHRDMDMIGYEMDLLRNTHRDYLWKGFLYYAEERAKEFLPEIKSLKFADDTVNEKKKEKDEIFISKAAMLLCYCNDKDFDSVLSSEIIKCDSLIEWENIGIKPIGNCRLAGNIIPEWVFDCHTLRGKRMGKTDWDMTNSEQAALYPLQEAYFDNASWAYTYEQDYENGAISYNNMLPIWEYGKTHKANPVEAYPYEEPGIN